MNGQFFENVSSVTIKPASQSEDLALDSELVPPGSNSAYFGCTTQSPHEFESSIRRQLLTLQSVSFDSLEVHQCRDGVCLSGRIEADGDADILHVEQTARDAGAANVYNRLVTSRRQISDADCENR